MRGPLRQVGVATGSLSSISVPGGDTMVITGLLVPVVVSGVPSDLGFFGMVAVVSVNPGSSPSTALLFWRMGVGVENSTKEATPPGDMCLGD